MLAGSCAPTSAAAQDTPESAARRIEAVKALAPKNEEKLDQRTLLTALGRNGAWMVRAENEVGRIEVSFTDAQGRPMLVSGWLSYDTTGESQMCMMDYCGAGISRVLGGHTTIDLRGEERRVELFSEGLPGYAFAKKEHDATVHTNASLWLPKDATNLQTTIALEPAGAIRWRVLDEAGTPETEKVRYWLYTQPYSASGVIDPIDGQMLIRPARLESPYRLVIHKGALFAASSAPLLTMDSPVADLVIAFKPGQTVAGRLVDADGRPVAGANLRLGYQLMEPQPTMMETATLAVTGADGAFAFESINLEMPNNYWVVFDSHDGANEQRPLPKHRIAINAKTPMPVEMRLPAVHAASGRLLDAKTAEPVAGVLVRALMHEQFSSTGRPNWLPVFEVPATAPTDERGEFHFTNLPAGVYDFRLSKGFVTQNREAVSAAGNLPTRTLDIDLLRVPQAAEDKPTTFWFRP